MMHQSPHMLMGSDPSRVKGVKVGRRTIRRILSFATPYRGALIGFILVIIAQALLALVPALLLRRIIDVAIPQSDRSMLTVLAAFIIGAALAAATLSFVERFYSARIGEGLIYDLRVRALRPRLGHAHRLLHPHPDRGLDQPGQQRRDRCPARRHHARSARSCPTSSCSPRRSSPCSLLEWRLTLLALLVLPIFIIPAKRVGRRLPAITRQGLDLNASMNTTMTERFNVSGAMLVKLFGHRARESDEFSGPGRTGARHRHQERPLRAHLLHRPHPASGPSAPPSSTGSAASS